MKLNAIDIFSNWAKSGKDERMASAHKNSVKEMLSFVLESYTKPFSLIDAGCGNGWVVRDVLSNSFCSNAIGIDGSFEMVKKAKSIDPNGEYYCSDLMDWRPKCKVDVVHSMEVFYYFKNPLDIVKHIVKNWIKPKGLLIMGIDHYVGNTDSYSWPKDLNVHMTLLSAMDWVKIFAESGLSNCRSWKVNQKENKPGTLVIAGNLV
tara:strand:+ start:106 stop:720 length:615 start_codon:yes stop_codon:yes gene_type:complete